MAIIIADRLTPWWEFFMVGISLWAMDMMMDMRWTSMICTDSFACSPPAAIAASRLVLVVPERKH